MSETETWTVGRLLQWTTNYLEQRDLDTCRLDAELLLAEARGCSRIELYTAYDEVAVVLGRETNFVGKNATAKDEYV